MLQKKTYAKRLRFPKTVLCKNDVVFVAASFGANTPNGYKLSYKTHSQCRGYILGLGS